jgi:hypothetical protein
MTDPTIASAMASYDGAKYLWEQLICDFGDTVRAGSAVMETRHEAVRSEFAGQAAHLVRYRRGGLLGSDPLACGAVDCCRRSRGEAVRFGEPGGALETESLAADDNLAALPSPPGFERKLGVAGDGGKWLDR